MNNTRRAHIQKLIESLIDLNEDIEILQREERSMQAKGYLSDALAATHDAISALDYAKE